MEFSFSYGSSERRNELESSGADQEVVISYTKYYTFVRKPE
jgi:hypothetical protein